MGLATSALCCAGQCACSAMSCCCSAATSARGGISTSAAKIWYVLMLGLATVLALVFRYEGDSIGLDLKVWEFSCTNSTHTSTDPSGLTHTYLYCKGDAAVYRISFVLTLFFALNLVCSFCGSGFHRGWWGPKIMLFFILLIGSVFISNNVFNNHGFATVSRIVSILFLLFQILLLIDFGYKWNMDWVQKAYADSASEYDDASDRKWLVGILVSAATLFILALVGIGVLYADYSCGLSNFATTVALIGMIAYTVISLFRQKIVGVEGAILPAAVVAAYTVFLTWSAMQSNPNRECNPRQEESTANIVIGIILAAGSLMWTSISASKSAENLLSGKEDTAEESTAGLEKPFYRVDEGGNTVKAKDSGNDVESGSNKEPEIDENGDVTSNGGERIWVFHLIMLTASMYMSMLLTNWGAEETREGNESGTYGTTSMWVKITSAWLTIALYTWTLIAPKVLSGRDFD